MRQTTFKAISMDLQRSFCSPGFLIAVIGVCIAYFLGAWDEIPYAKDILYLYKYSSMSSAFNMLTVLFCVLPFTTSFCNDWDSQFIRASVIRSGVDRYGFSKLIACAFSSGIAIALGTTLFILLLLLKVPLVFTSTDNFQFFATRTIGGSFLLNKQYIIYFAVNIYLGFLAGAFWSVVGLCASTYMLNRFIALCTPFIAHYFLNLITYSFPIWLRLNVITQGRCILGGTLWSLVYITFLFCILTCGVGLLFIRNVRRRLANG